MDLTLLNPFFEMFLGLWMASIMQLLYNLVLFIILEFFSVILSEIIHHAGSVCSDFSFALLKQIYYPFFLKPDFIKIKPLLAFNVEFLHALLFFPRGGVEYLVCVGVLRT